MEVWCRNFMLDTHCHLCDEQFNNDLNSVINQAKEQGVSKIVDVGYDLKTSQKALNNAKANENFILATCGIHPHDAQEENKNNFLEKLEELITNPKNKKYIVALGEIGLDYYKNYTKNEVQIYYFKEQLLLAKKLSLPVIIHLRNAYEDTLKILIESKINLPIILHCFSGDKNFAEKSIAQNYFISFSGIITYLKAENLREVLKIVPLKNLLLETDAPYLAPQNFKGKRNEPSYIKETYLKTAQIKNMEIEELKQKIRENFKKIFNI